MANEHLVILPAEWYLKVGCSCTYYAMFSTKYLETKKFEAPPHCPNTWRAEPRKEKCSFLFQKKSGTRKSEKQGTFFFSGLPREARRWGGFRRAYGLILSHHALRASHQKVGLL